MGSLLEFFDDDFLINILDVGAALSESPVYQPLVDVKRAKVIGFEPNPLECEKLTQKYGPPHQFFPYFVGDGQPAIFYETNWELTGSLFEPNPVVLNKFLRLGEFVQLVKTHSVLTKSIDSIIEIDDVDFFKIDIQGGELQVFQNALKILDSALVIQTEVEFVELYKGQPLFADVDIFLRSKGFQFHSFAGFGSRNFRPLVSNNDPHTGSQMLWADAYYLTDWLKLETLSINKLKKYAVISHDMLKLPDLTYLILNTIDCKIETNFADRYLQHLNSAG